MGVATLPIQSDEAPVDIAKRALREGKLGGFDVVIFDTAGRTHIDDELMAETANVKAAIDPHEILLVADALTGQDAVNLARSFDARVNLTGIVLTRVDANGIVVHDPAIGVRRLSLAQASKHFTGVALELTPTGGFQPAEAPPANWHEGHVTDADLASSLSS